MDRFEWQNKKCNYDNTKDTIKTWRAVMKGIKNKGFTLIEILVSLAILGIVLAGIYSVYNMQHKSYIVQEQVTEMQQSERVALQMITRDIRMAGLGLQFCNDAAGGKIIFSNGTGNNNSDTIGVEYHSFSPKPEGETEITTNVPAISASSELDVKDTTGFNNNDWVMVAGGEECQYAIFYVDTVDAGTKKLHHTSTSKLTYGYKLTSGFMIGDRVRRLNREDGGRIIYAIDGSYILTRSVDDGTAQPLADNIEDMQIAYGIDINNNGIVADGKFGVVPGGEWFDDPTGRDMTLLREIKLTLVARTTREDPAYNAGARPAVEDNPAAPAADGFRRRVLQTTVKLRNIDETVARF